MQLFSAIIDFFIRSILTVQMPSEKDKSFSRQLLLFSGSSIRLPVVFLC